MLAQAYRAETANRAGTPCRSETDLIDFNLSSQTTQKTVVANCSAPIVAHPTGTRAFTSPTFCEEGSSGSSGFQ